MTFEEIKTCDKAFLTAFDIRGLLECDNALILSQAHKNPKQLGFPVIVIERRVRIPRKAFIRYWEENVI